MNTGRGYRVELRADSQCDKHLQFGFRELVSIGKSLKGCLQNG